MVRLRHVRARRGSALAPADIAQPRPERQFIDAPERQAGKGRDSILEIAECSDECRFLLKVRALDLARVFDAPMRRQRLAGPNGARLASRAVTDREKEIHQG